MDSSQTPHTHHTRHLRPTNLFTATTESVGSNEGTELEFATEDLPPENILQLTLQHQTVEEVHSLSTKRLNTTAGRLIEAIIGRAQEVQAFDELRAQLRSYKNQNTVPTGSEKSTYNTLLQKLKKNVRTELHKIKLEIRQIEQEHYHLHNTFPSNTNIKYKVLRKKLDKGRYLHTV